MHHFMYTYVGRDNKLLHCIVPLPAPPGAVSVQSFGAKQVQYALIILCIYVIYVLRTD